MPLLSHRKDPGRRTGWRAHAHSGIALVLEFVQDAPPGAKAKGNIVWSLLPTTISKEAAYSQDNSGEAHRETGEVQYPLLEAVVQGLKREEGRGVVPQDAEEIGSSQ